MRHEALIQLEHLSGPRDGVIVSFSKDSVVIGRDDNADIRVQSDQTVSRRHALISREGNDYFIEDLQSKNGTFVGKEKITGRTKLEPGVPFRVGRSWFVVVEHR